MAGIIVRRQPVSSVSEAVADFLAARVLLGAERIAGRPRERAALAGDADLAELVAGVEVEEAVVDARVAGRALGVVGIARRLAVRVLPARRRRRADAIGDAIGAGI